MKKIKLLFIIVVLKAGILIPVSGQSVGDEAPDFTYNDLFGNEVTLSEFEGKVVFLYFFGNTCSLCRTIGNDTETKVQEIFGTNDNFQALGLDVWPGSNTSSVGGFKDFTGITYPLLLNAEDIKAAWGIVHNRIIVIDADGIIRHKGTDPVVNDLDNAIGVVQEYITLASEQEVISKPGYSLGQNYPNPVTGSTTIRYSLDRPGKVSFVLINTIGEEVFRMVEDYAIAGSHDLQLSLEGMAPGIYFYQMNVNDYSAARKLIIK